MTQNVLADPPPMSPSTTGSAAGHSGLRRITGGDDPFPLWLLSALFFFDEFDTAAFAVLAPNIQEAYDLSTSGFSLLVISNLSIVLALAVPVGYYGDRLPRPLMVVVGGILAGIFSALTGAAMTLTILVLVRLGNGVGRLVNDTVQVPLLADYYKPHVRPGVIAFHRNAEQLGRIVGPLVAGLVAFVFGWRAAFFVLLLPVVGFALMALKLKDPVRGGTDDPDAAQEAQKEKPPPFREAARIILAVASLRRQYLAIAFIGAGLIPISFLPALYFEEAYGVGNFGRGAIASLFAVAGFVGIALGGYLTPRWIAKDKGEPMRWAGWSTVSVGIGLLLTTAAPVLWLTVLFGTLTSFTAGIFNAPYYTVQAMVAPARVRALAFASGSLALLAGVWVLYLIIPVSRISDEVSARAGLAATAPYWIIGGLLLRSVAKHVSADAQHALDALALTARLRRERASGDGATLLACRGVDVAYDGVQVLFGVDMEVRQGEIVALLGTNGAGKSTLLKAICGLVDPIGGAIYFDGRDITHSDPAASAAVGIVQVPGGKGIFPTLTVAEHFTAASWMFRKDSKRVEQAVDEVLDRFPRLRERYGQLAGNLSGGEQQQLALSMAFIARPKLLIIDELSLGLSPNIVEQLLVLVREIHKQGATIVLVEQSLNVALTVADRAYFLEKGTVRFEGSTKELMGRDDIVRSVFLEGAGAPKTGSSAARAKARPSAPTAAEPPSDGAPPIAMEAIGIRKGFGGIQAVAGVDLSVRKGEILGLIGPNGAGKTTVFDMLSGFLIPDSGAVRMLGREVTRWSPDQRARAGLGRSFQDARIFPSLTVAENLATSLERHLPFHDHLASALALPAVGDLEEDIAYSVNDLVELMNLGDYRSKFVSELSTGSRRVVDLAMAIAHDPEVLILDEPSSGIAQRETEALGPLLHRIRDETGCAMLVIEHDMPLIIGVSDRMLALELGRVIAEGTPEQVIADPRVVASYLGTDEAAISRSGSGPAAPRPTSKRTKGTT